MPGQVGGDWYVYMGCVFDLGVGCMGIGRRVAWWEEGGVWGIRGVQVCAVFWIS
jgi:hypothetical protein